MIKNIVFDIGKVLVRFDWEDYLASFQFPEEETTAIAKAMFLSSNWNLVDEGRLSYEEIEQILSIPVLHMQMISDWYLLTSVTASHVFLIQDTGFLL